MFLSKFFGRKSTVVQNVQAYTKPCTCKAGVTNYAQARRNYDQPNIVVNVPATVDGALLAHQIEHQLKRHAA